MQASFSRIKRIKMDTLEYLRPTKEIEEEEREQAARHSSIGTWSAPPRCQRARRQEGPVDQLTACAHALVRYRCYQDYGDHLFENRDAAADEQEDMAEIRDLVESDWAFSFVDISERLMAEERMARESMRAPGGRETPVTTPWLDDVERAVLALRSSAMTADQLVWEIHEYARRENYYRVSIDDFVLWNDADLLGRKILRDLNRLDSMGAAGSSLQMMKLALCDIRDRYFHFCKIQPNGFPCFIPRYSEWPVVDKGKGMAYDW
ncbi:hypothetical protein SLS58_001714 [Diplodia intermedia]|uniref:Uncharacterized protein n=1 Tax=Diplodia intermedia TaxID=856260 RepID=A0ABR3U2B8_9PEZI